MRRTTNESQQKPGGPPPPSSSSSSSVDVSKKNTSDAPETGARWSSHSTAFASYIMFRLMKGVLYDIFAAHLLSLGHPEARTFRKFNVQIDALKLLHILFTLTVPDLLLRHLGKLFGLVTALFVAAVSAVLVSLHYDTELLSVFNCSLLVALAVLMIATDAATDALVALAEP